MGVKANAASGELQENTALGLTQDHTGYSQRTPGPACLHSCLQSSISPLCLLQNHGPAGLQKSLLYLSEFPEKFGLIKHRFQFFNAIFRVAPCQVLHR